MLEFWDRVEVWAAIVGFEDIYEVSSWGYVRRVQRASGCTVNKKIKLKYTLDRNRCKRYPKVTLSVAQKTTDKLVHILVLEAFIGLAPDGYEADHIDGNTMNNRLSNLRWLMIAENRAQGNQRR